MTVASHARPAAVVTYDHDCFKIGGVDTALYSGDVQYFRCPRGEWRDVLEKTKAAGFNTVQFYVPWNYHEKTYGQPNFEELEAFLALCDQMDLYVIIRIGPYIGGEWDNGGYPAWLVDKVPPRSYRTNDPTYTRYVMHWYDEVLAVIRSRTIDHGGPIILLQIENEYGNASPMKKEVLKALYARVIQNGVQIPVVGCDTPNAWDKTDPIMAKIVSGNNCHNARFGSISRVEAQFAESRAREPQAPTIMLEMRSGEGRYSNWTDLPVDVAVDPTLTPLDYAQINKTAWMMGAGLTNYYTLYGGTSFDYNAACFGSTAYCGRPPVQCPLLEGGGLSEAYYEVKLIGQWLQTFGAKVVRAHDPLEVLANRFLPFHYAVGHWCHVRDGSPWPMMRETVVGQSAFLYLRDDVGRAREIQFTYPDPRDGREVRVPAEGYLMLPARDMLVLPVNVDVGGRLMAYTTSQILGIDKVGNRTVVVAYGPPGTSGEMAFELPHEPSVYGPAKSHWNAQTKTLRLNYAYTEQDQHIGFENVEIVVVTKGRAYRTWDVRSADEHLKVVSDAYFVQPTTSKSPNTVSFEAQTRPGLARFSVVLPRAPQALRVNGAPTPFAWDAGAACLRFDVGTSALQERAHQTGGIRFHRDDLAAGAWQPAELKPLEQMGIAESGYVRYRATFHAAGAERAMVLRLFEGSLRRDSSEVGDPLLVYLNGKFVPEASGWIEADVTLDPSKYLQAGDNTLLVCFEKLSRPVGRGVGKRKGLASVVLQRADGGEQRLARWEFLRGLSGQNEGYQKPDFDDRSWADVWTGGTGGPGVAWYRISFSADSDSRVAAPLKIHLKSDGDALLYLNGRLVGRRMREDWQTEFYLPDDLVYEAGPNSIAIAVREYANSHGALEASVGTYDSFTVARNDVTIVYQ